MSVVEESMTACAGTAERDRKRGMRLPVMVTFVGTVLAFVGITFAAGAPSPLFVLFQQEWQFPSWVLSLAFAIYAITLLLTLLVAGSLSDHIGRRPLLIAALVTEVASMAIFVFAPNIAWIIAARAIQGIATGAATSTFSATIVEYAPDRFKKISALITSVAPVGGLALGALATGFAVQFSAYPSQIIFGALAILFLLGTLVIIGAPETVTRRPGAIRSLIPRLSVPVAARRDFALTVPVLVSSWMLAGLFLGLAPSIIRGIFGIDSGLVNGALVALQPAAGAVAAVAFGRFAAGRVVRLGTIAVLLGIALFITAVATHVFALLFVAAIVGGAGFGASFSASLRTLAPLAGAHERAELFSAIYLVNYLSYGAPALVAGELIGVIGLEPTVVGYGAVAILVAAVGVVARRTPKRAVEALVTD